jgi:hypothetical protein
MVTPTSSPLQALVGRLAARLRYPHLFLLLAGLFVADLVIPDMLPFVDEALLALLTVLVGSWRTRREPPQGPPTSPGLPPGD